jgi:hypothetical protein
MASHGASDVPKGVTVPAFRGSALRRRSPSSTTGADTSLPARLWAVAVPTVQVRDVADVDRPWLRFIDVVRAAKPDVDEGTFCNAIEFEWRIGLGTGV